MRPNAPACLSRRSSPAATADAALVATGLPSAEASLRKGSDPVGIVPRVQEIVGHYGDTALLERIIVAVEKAGIDLNDLTVDDLAPVDEFHIGGRAATESLMQRASIAPGSRVLDVGSGLGGTARYLAATGSHTVTGVDLTPEYVEVAGALNELVGLDGSVTVQQADVCDLPFRSAGFQAAAMLHVGMNVYDKVSAFKAVESGTIAPTEIVASVRSRSS